jgi:hypothetical protein
MRHLAMIVVTTSLVLALADVAAAPAAVAAPAYEMILIPPSAASGPTYFRINVATGQAMYNLGTQFVPTVDASPLPQGDYHLYPAVKDDGKGSYWLYKMDSQSGHAWFLTSGAWTTVAEPK